MELSFVLSALRRRFWVVSLFAFLGALPGILSDPPVSNDYESVAKLSIQQPSQGNVTFFQVDPDRYLVGQISELQSVSLLQSVVENLCLRNEAGIPLASLPPDDPDREPDVQYQCIEVDQQNVQDSIEIEQEDGADVVSIRVVARDAATAQAIAQTFVDTYIGGLETDSLDDEELGRVSDKIDKLEARLSALNDRLKRSMEGPIELSRNARNPIAIPLPSAVDPAAVSEIKLIESQLTTLYAQQNALIGDSRLRVNTRAFQRATLNQDPIPVGQQFLLAGGLFSGAMLGLIIALAWARFSTKVLDEETASEVLGIPVVAEFAHYRSIARQPLAAFQSLPRSAVPIVDQLCVRAEAKARIDEPLAVVVVGTQRSAGATTLSLAMAERFASGGSSVVLVDADVRDPRITAIFNATNDGGVPAVVANDGALIDNRGRSVFTRTMDPEVSVLGLGPNRGAASLRRETVSAVLEAARRKAQVVVFDGGPALDLASTLQLAGLADAVVLAVPLARQKTDALGDLSRELRSVRDKLLPVVTSPARRSAKGDVVALDGAIAVPAGGLPGGDLPPPPGDSQQPQDEAMSFGNGLGQ